MAAGDLVTIKYCPFDSPNLFGYQNGDIAIVTAILNADLATIGNPSARLWLLNSGHRVIVPIQYIEKMET